MSEKKKTITINGVEYAVKPGFKAMIIFEKITNGPFQIKNTTDVLYYIYSSILSGTEEVKLEVDAMLEAFDNDQNLFVQAMQIVFPDSALDKLARISNESDGGTEPKKD